MDNNHRFIHLSSISLNPFDPHNILHAIFISLGATWYEIERMWREMKHFVTHLHTRSRTYKLFLIHALDFATEARAQTKNTYNVTWSLMIYPRSVCQFSIILWKSVIEKKQKKKKNQKRGLYMRLSCFRWLLKGKWNFFSFHFILGSFQMT